MKALKVCGWFLLMGALLNIMGCNRLSPRSTPQHVVVTVTNCVPDKDPVEVAINDTVKWVFTSPAGHNYSISFPGRKPIATATPTIGQDHLVKGDSLCSATFGWKCYYPYVVKDGAKLCGDPGVHVGSGGP